MRRLSWIFCLALAATVCSVAPAAARVRPSDAAATHAYLEARIVSQRATEGTAQTDLGAIAALEAQVLAECPGALDGAPPHAEGEKTNESEHEISDELLTAVFGAAEHVEHPADAQFARTVRRLRWSNPRLTRLLRSLALEQAEQSAIPVPNLCSDVRFWVASGYTAVSAATKGFLHRHDVVSSITVIESEPHEPALDFIHLDALVAHRLAPYEDHADRLLVKKAIPPEAKLTEAALKPFLEAVGKVLAALGRPPTPTA